MKAEAEKLKADLTTLREAFDGKTQNGRTLITRPHLQEKDFTSGNIFC